MDVLERNGQEYEQLNEKLYQAFCWFHSHPELSYEEHETTEKIREFLTNEGIEILPGGPPTGLVAVIRGEKEGPVQALRCDIDALPVKEESGVSYPSLYPGRMHACGHDFHITAGLGTAVLLNARKKELKGTVKILFQAAEEAVIGAVQMIETGLAEDVTQFWGIHADPTNEVMTLGIRPGYVAAAVDRFSITVKGIGCHGAHPDDGIDPIPAACAIVQALQTIVSRNMNAFRPTLLSVTRFQAGNTWNVVPETAVLEGTVRTMEKKDRELYQKRIHEIALQTAAAYGARAEVNWIAGAPAVVNDERLSELAARVGREVGFEVVDEEQSLGGDDFSFYQEKGPGCYIKIGTGKGQTIHQSGFRVKPEVLVPAARYLTELLLRHPL